MRFNRSLIVLLILACGCGRTEVLIPRSSQPGAADRSATGPCKLSVLPTDVDFGIVDIGSFTMATVHLTNSGGTDCEISSISLDPTSDYEFGLLGAPPMKFVVPADDSALFSVTFWAQDHQKPHERSGTLHIANSGTIFSIPLKAQIALGCDLVVSPNPLNFGNVPLNTSMTDTVTLTNQGTSPCDIANVALDALTDPLFSLASNQATSVTLAPDDTASIQVTFNANDSTEPHLRMGTLDFGVTQPSGTPLNPPQSVAVPLLAFISTECTAGSQWIYTVDSSGMLSTFNPTDFSFTDIGYLNCPTWGTPFSMAVDQHTIAWVEYDDWSIYRVDLATNTCTSTTFTPDPQNEAFGMGFVFQPSTGLDTLYVAGSNDDFTATTSVLSTISFPDLKLTQVATVNIGSPELTGTGDGQLWGFSPPNNGTPALLAQIDPATGWLFQIYTLDQVTGGGGWALKFWGGSFWLFLGSEVYEVPRATGQAKLVVSNTGRNIVGAGVSTCAPIQ